jgi:hypothetical protein
LARDDSLRGPRRLPSTLVVLAGYAVLALVMTWPMAREFGRAIPGDGFDGWQNYWNLWWVRIALTSQHTSPFFTDLLYYPTGVSLLFHTLNVFNGLLTLPIQLAFGLFPAYNAVVLFSFMMGGFGAYLLARDTLGGNGSRFPAFAAGVIFSFSPFHFAHLLGHMQVISLEWIPFYALYLLKLVRGTERRGAMSRNSLMAGLFLVLIGLCDLYYVLYCLLFTGVVIAWALWRAWRFRRAGQAQHADASDGATRRQVPALRRAIFGVGAAWLLFGLILAPQLAPMIAEAQRAHYMIPDPGQSRLLSADLAAFITPQEFHPIWGDWAAERGKLLAASPAEHQVFTGFTVLILAAIALWKGWQRPTRGGYDPGPWPITLLTFFVLALGPVLHIAGQSALLPGGSELSLPYGWLVRIVPFMEITRSVSRFDVMIMLSLGLLAALGLQWLWDSGRAARIVSIAAVGLILFEFLPVPYPMSPPDVPFWYETLAQDAQPGAVLNLPMGWDRPGYLLQQTVHGKPLTVAYISREDPRTLTERIPVLQHFRHLGPDIIQADLAVIGKQVLQDLGVGWVVVDRYQMPGGDERTYTDAAVAQIFGSQPPLYEDDRITVYGVLPDQGTEPYLILDAGWGQFDESSHTRSFEGSASVIVRSPVEVEAVVSVKLAPDSAGLDIQKTGGQYTLPLRLQRGDNKLLLRASEPGQQITVVSLAVDAKREERAQ